MGASAAAEATLRGILERDLDRDPVHDPTGASVTREAASELGTILAQRQAWAEAQPPLERAVGLTRRVAQGPVSPSAGRDVVLLFGVLQATGQAGQAKELCVEALDAGTAVGRCMNAQQRAVLQTLSAQL